MSGVPALRRIILKDPNASLDYKFIWYSTEPGVPPWLQPTETITTSSVTVPTGLIKESEEIVDDGRNVLVWLSGGTAGQTYDVTCHITTNAQRTDDRTMTIAVQNR